MEIEIEIVFPGFNRKKVQLTARVWAHTFTNSNKVERRVVAPLPAWARFSLLILERSSPRTSRVARAVYVMAEKFNESEFELAIRNLQRQRKKEEELPKFPTGLLNNLNNRNFFSEKTE